MRGVSLFTGVGGMDLAFEWAGGEVALQVEIEPYCQKVLARHWPHVRRIADVRDVTADDCRGADIIFGGFPCQPHSVAGKRRGSEDGRDLWGEFARIICTARPRWVVAENVRGLLSSEDGRFMGRVLRDLAEAGYDALWQVLSAEEAGAPHRRERVFIVAHTNSELAHRTGRSRRWRAEFTDGAWWAVESGVCGVVHGVPNRTHRIAALGRAVVPQVVYPIFKAIVEAS